MKRLCLVMVLLTGLVPHVHSQVEYRELWAQQKKENTAFNRTVTDQEIIEFLEFQYAIDYMLLRELRQHLKHPDKRRTYLENYRAIHNQAGMRIPTLSSMSDDELSQMRGVPEYQKREHELAHEAGRRLDRLSRDELAAVLREGIKLIQGFRAQHGPASGHLDFFEDDFPASLQFLALRSIQVSAEHCRLLLQKGVGRGIGLTVVKENDEWVLLTFDEYKSWARQRVAL